MLLLFCGETGRASHLLQQHMAAKTLSLDELERTVKDVTDRYGGPYIAETTVPQAIKVLDGFTKTQQGNSKAVLFLADAWRRDRGTNVDDLEYQARHSLHFTIIDSSQREPLILAELLKLLPEQAPRY